MNLNVKTAFLEVQKAFNVFTSKQLGGPDDERGCLLCFDDGSVLGFPAHGNKICSSKFGAADVLVSYIASEYELEQMPSSRIAFAENRVPLRDCDGECDWSTAVHASEFVSKKWEEWDQAQRCDCSEDHTATTVCRM